MRKEGQPLLFQIYLDRDRKKSEALVKKVVEMGFDGIMFTIGQCPHPRQPALRVLVTDWDIFHYCRLGRSREARA